MSRARPRKPERVPSLPEGESLRRATEFAVLLTFVLAVLLGLVAFAGLSLVGAVSGGTLIAGLFLFYYAATADSVHRLVAFDPAEPQRDEDDRKLQDAQNERALRIAIIEALPEPAMYIDAQGRVEAANAAARKCFRFVVAEPILSAVVRRPELLNAVAAARAEKTAQMFEFIERDETDRYFSCIAAPLNTRNASGVLLSMHDQSAVRRAELARADFLANASHELRTPLTSLSGFIETMRGPARKDPESWDRFLEIMQGQAERMRRLIHDLLSLSRIELNEHRPPEGTTDLAVAVAEVAEALSLLAGQRGVKLRILGPASGVWVVGERDELIQVAQNLVDNAIKYSVDNGVVEIEVLAGLPGEEAVTRAGRRWPSAGHMSIATTAGTVSGGRFAILRVTDSGPGIDRQHLPRLAERFYRVDPGRGLKRGTGLGLAIVKHVVTRHRGQFLVESEVDRGSAFGVVLPAAEPPASGGQLDIPAANGDLDDRSLGKSA